MTGDEHILDATCGSRMIWFDKYCDEAVYMDNRVVKDVRIWKSTKNDSARHLTIDPDIVADFTDMPFDDNSFNLVVFDPPHLQKLGETSWLCAKYGRLEGAWENMIHDGFAECWRVCAPYGTIIFKWSEIDIKIRKIISVIGHEPLFGNRSGKHLSTHWMVFMKFPEKEEE